MQHKQTDKQNRYRKTKHVLGEGSYKTVTKAIDEEEGKEVAYNEVRIRNYELETKAESSFSKEISLLRSLDHPNIIKIIDYWFSDDNFIFITEFMTGGSLNDYIEKNGPLSTKLIRKWGKQILEGLAYLHTQDPPIIHRDIKNDNIFVNTAVGEVKIGDLGLARERRNKRYTVVGTPYFMAREMFEGEGYTEKVDMYAFGMCLIEMATGKRPYNEFDDTKDIYKSVLQGILPKAFKLVTDPCLKSLIVSCLVPTGFRFTSSQCLDHHFFHTDVMCTGSCIPEECVAVYPLIFETVTNMELSIVAVFETIITFQILFFDTMRFIKFEYDMNVDTVDKVSGELISEKIIDQETIENFSKLLKMGLETVESKMKVGKVHDGIIELTSLETANMMDRNIVISNDIRKVPSFESSSSEQVFHIGEATLEEMALIEERMKIQEAKMELEKRKEEETSFRLKSKLLQKDASYEPTIIKACDCIVDGKITKQELEKESNCCIKANDNTNELTNDKTANELTNKKTANELTNNKTSNDMANNKTFNESANNKTSKDIANDKETDLTSAKAHIEPASKKPAHKKENRSYLIDSDSDQTIYSNKSPNLCEPEENIYLQFPPVFENIEKPEPINFSHYSTSSIPQHLENALSKIEALHISAAKLNAINSPQPESEINSSPVSFSNEKFSEEQIVNDLCLSESYEKTKIKYRSNCSIYQFAFDCATITGRTEETAKSWIKLLKEEHLETVFDLKLIAYEDWQKLPLTVFASRAMQNMIYGVDGTPLKEKQLPLNSKIAEYENKMKIKDFLFDVCEQICRPELVSSWEDRLLAEDIQTVGELKSLHQDDWNRLGLSVFGYRILKNTILRKGKILIDDLK